MRRGAHRERPRAQGRRTPSWPPRSFLLSSVARGQAGRRRRRRWRRRNDGPWLVVVLLGRSDEWVATRRGTPLRGCPGPRGGLCSGRSRPPSGRVRLVLLGLRWHARVERARWGRRGGNNNNKILKVFRGLLRVWWWCPSGLLKNVGGVVKCGEADEWWCAHGLFGACQPKRKTQKHQKKKN